MKKYLLTTIGALLVAISAYAVDVTIGWDLNPPADMVNKYIIYQADSTNGTFYPVVTVLNTNVGTVRGVSTGFHRFVVVANNGVGNAPPSNEVSVPTNAPSATKNVIILNVK